MNYIDPFYEPNKDLYWNKNKPYKGKVVTEIPKHKTIVIPKQPLTLFQEATIRQAIQNGGFVFSESELLLQIKTEDKAFTNLLENIGVHFEIIF